MSLARKLALALLPTVALLVALELGLRAYDVLTGAIVSEDLLTGWYASSTEGHPFLEYTSRRNFHGLLAFHEPGRRYEVRTNSHGFRTREFYPKLPGWFRVVIMGDSWVWGYNANQGETVAAVLEGLLRARVADEIEVLSLSGPSYAGVRYAALARIYLDYLRPDLMIVAPDQSDFEEDVAYIKGYVTDDEGAPLVLKRARELAEHVRSPHRVVIDADGTLRVVERVDWMLRLRMGSSLVNHAFELAGRVGRWVERVRASRRPPVRPEEIRRPEVPGEDVRALVRTLPRRLLHDLIPYPLGVARERYQPTFRALRFIKREGDRRGVALYLSSYPYPWMVSVGEAVAFQRAQFGGIYDLRQHRVHPQLMAEFARALGVPHLDAYPTFEREGEGKYGDYDPHFNAAGHARYARFLYDAIESDVRRLACGSLRCKSPAARAAGREAG